MSGLSGGAIRKEFLGCWAKERKEWRGINPVVTAFAHQEAESGLFGGSREIELAHWKAVPGEQFASYEEGFGNDESWLGLEGVSCHWEDAAGGHWRTWNGVGISYCCCNKWPPKLWLNTAQIYHLTIMEVRIQKGPPWVTIKLLEALWSFWRL